LRCTKFTTPAAPDPRSCSVALYPTKSIKLGAANDPEQVRLLEQFLNVFEGANVPVDGIYSVADEAVVRAWQEKYRSEILTPWGTTKGTGYVFITSLRKIKSVQENNCTRETPVAPRFSTTLEYGMTHPQVRQLQNFLNTHGSPVAPSGVGSLNHETSYFGLATKAALIKFQIAHNITPNGIFGPLTWVVVEGE
jgi:peptidoglycan hydrolase-like protein with peptidoglycan-binding domain